MRCGLYCMVNHRDVYRFPELDTAADAVTWWWSLMNSIHVYTNIQLLLYIAVWPCSFSSLFYIYISHCFVVSVIIIVSVISGQGASVNNRLWLCIYRYSDCTRWIRLSLSLSFAFIVQIFHLYLYFPLSKHLQIYTHKGLLFR